MAKQTCKVFPPGARSSQSALASPWMTSAPPPPSPLGQAPGSSQRRGQGSGFEDIVLVALTDFSGSPEAPAAYPADPAAFPRSGPTVGDKACGRVLEVSCGDAKLSPVLCPVPGSTGLARLQSKTAARKTKQHIPVGCRSVAVSREASAWAGFTCKKTALWKPPTSASSGFLLQRPACSFVCRLQAFSGQKSTVSSSVIRGFAKAVELSPRVIISSESPRPRGCLVFTFIH